MQSPHTQDLIAQRDQVKNEIKNLESKLAESRMKLGIFESAIVRSEDIDKTQPNKTVIVKHNILTSIPDNNKSSIEERVISFLQGKTTHSARASDITDALGEGNRDINMKIYTSINRLIKQGKIQIEKEYDSMGSERQRNRLYQLTSFV